MPNGETPSQRPDQGPSREAGDKIVRNYRWIIYLSLLFALSGAGLSILHKHKSGSSSGKSSIGLIGEDPEEVAARDYLKKTFGDKAMKDPNTGAMLVRPSLKRIARKEKKKGIKNPLTCEDICGKEVCAVRIELEAFMRANKKAVADKKGCIKVSYSRRTQAWQCRSHKKARVMKDGKPVCRTYINGAKKKGGSKRKRVCVPKTHYPIAMCGFSFHEAGRAYDVTTWRKHQKYLWDEGFSGGMRGIRRDPVHFSRGEFSNKYCKPSLKWKDLKECGKLGGNYLDITKRKLKAKGIKFWKWLTKKRK